MIPDRLEDWSYNKIKELVDKNINESKIHDFKFVLPGSIELTRTAVLLQTLMAGL